METNKIIKGDCLEVLKTFPDNTFDSIITDPPYEIGFMKNEWDRNGISFNVDLWKEILRVSKHGAYLLAFGGTRTYHRIACAIEDAGFEIRDMIEWVYGSGFPKSLNIGKQIDKIQGNERIPFLRKDGKASNSGSGCYNMNNGKDNCMKKEFIDTKGFSEWEGWGTALKPAHEPIVVARKPIEKGLNVAENVLKWGTGGLNIDENRVEYINEKDRIEGQSARISKTKDTLFPLGGFDRSKRDNLNGRFPANLIHDGSDEVKECFPEKTSYGHWTKTKVTGYGKFGNGSSEYFGVGEKDKSCCSASRFFKECPFTDEDLKGISLFYCAKASKSERNGRFPANLIHDGSDEVKECFPYQKSGNRSSKYNIGNEKGEMYNHGIYGIYKAKKYEDVPASEGSASRFFKECPFTDEDLKGISLFYCAKASKSERNNGLEYSNNHPTIKPIKLMEYLVKLVTRKGGLVLDPFAGSGSTLIACAKNGYNFVGIEINPEYVKIAEKRIRFYLNQNEKK